MVRVASVFLLVCVCSAAPVSAQEPEHAAAVAAPEPVVAGVADTTAPLPSPQLRAAKRPSLLVPLYVSTATLQGLDYVSTTRALQRGGREANPVMHPIVGNPVTFAAVKAGAAAGTIWLSEKMWKRSRVGAVVLMAAVNGAMTAVVSHNLRAVN